MNKSLLNKLEALIERFEEITALLSDPDVQGDQNKFRSLSQEYSQLESIVETYRQFQEKQDEIAESKEMLSDPEMAELAQESISDAKQALEVIEPKLQTLLLPRDPDDQKNIFIEVRAGTGGAEAALFSADLMRMYLRFAESKGWKTETISKSDGEMGG